MNYDVIIIGAGHAGIEASLASARMGCNTLILTMDSETIGLMSCNPAIGGVGKGQLVKEVDALGGEMAKAADSCAIQFRILNASKGAAVRSSRLQIDLSLYNQYMKERVSKQKNLTLKTGEANKLIIERDSVKGVVTAGGEELFATCVVISPGTFLDGMLHVGLKHFPGGRINPLSGREPQEGSTEPAAIGLAANLKELGFNLLRFKTGTCARLDKNTIDYSRLKEQIGDNPPRPLSFSTRKITQPQVPCYITYTNAATHKIIRSNLDRSPLYQGIIKATGVRYCPSIEDKVVKFSDKPRHQIFLEPQGLSTNEVYPNGLSTSLPEDVQIKLIHSIEGLEEAKIIRFGYGIEYTVVEPTHLYPTLETKIIKNLYLAGQINGTTGYEEAAALGLVAGINAALRVQKRDPLILGRNNSYIGVLIDDLTTKGTTEPYRMFTSRVEYRLLLREDNADIRLAKTGYIIGLLTEKDYRLTENKAKEIEEGIKYLKETRIKPSEEVNSKLASFNTQALRKISSLEELLKRPKLVLKSLMSLSSIPISEKALPQVEIEVKYSGFIERQRKDVEHFEHLERIKLPGNLEYKDIPSLSWEIKEKLGKFRPLTLGQASRISGVTPAAISILMVYLKKLHGQK